MIAEMTSGWAAGHRPAGVARSPSSRVWIPSAPRQEGFLAHCPTAWRPATVRGPQVFMPPLSQACENHTECLVVVNLSEYSRTGYGRPLCRPA